MPEFKPILLAEDSPYDAELTLKAFADSGLANRVVRVEDGVEALEYLRREGRFSQREPGNPTVAILDLKMPRLDGIGTLRAIRADPVLKLLPVVIMTSSREDRDLLESYQTGANAYVVKPVQFSEFLPAIKGVGVFWAVINETAPESAAKNPP